MNNEKKIQLLEQKINKLEKKLLDLEIIISNNSIKNFDNLDNLYNFNTLNSIDSLDNNNNEVNLDNEILHRNFCMPPPLVRQKPIYSNVIVQSSSLVSDL